MGRLNQLTTTALLILFLAAAARAEVRVPSLIGDNMVLQQGERARVWGTAAPGERVTVTLAGRTASASADAQGRWQVFVGPLTAGGPHTLKVAGSNTLTFRNVLVGEVWVCSGQSNMEWPLSQTAGGREESARATQEGIRLFTVEKQTSAEPLADVRGRWVVLTPAEALGFSAVAYYFGRELHARLRVPVGLIHTSWGGTPAEAWTSRAALAAREEFRPILERYEQEPGHENQNNPTVLYNAMLAPLTPYRIRGAIWYQGESNAGRAYQYRALFPAMIRDWRARWGQGDFPFYFVQLANWRPRKPEPSESDWAELREAQFMTLDEVLRVGMAVAVDIGDAEDIHPRNKRDVGLRLARWALADAYKQRVVPSGPLYESHKVEGDGVRVRFQHAAGLKTSDGRAPVGFAVAGPDRKFVWADARIEGDAVVVRSRDVPRPVAVRYAWADNPEVNLYNAQNLPASPFRTDDWPGLTAGKN